MLNYFVKIYQKKWENVLFACWLKLSLIANFRTIFCNGIYINFAVMVFILK